MLMSERMRMPLSTPETATEIAAPIINTMSAICTGWVCGMAYR